MPVPTHLLSFWQSFITATPGVDSTRLYEAFYFGDNDAMAHELGALVMQGRKRATAGSLWSYEATKQPLPQAGNLSIVTDFSGQPLCVIETRSIEVLPFAQVSADFAASEGEGDGSLEFWRQAHREFFTRSCARIGQTFSDSMLVVCERFDVVYRRKNVDYFNDRT